MINLKHLTFKNVLYFVYINGCVKYGFYFNYRNVYQKLIQGKSIWHDEFYNFVQAARVLCMETL